MSKWWNDNFGPRQEGGLGNIGSVKRSQQVSQGSKDAVVGRSRALGPLKTSLKSAPRSLVR